MIKEEYPVQSSKAKQSEDLTEQVKELSEDMELISPGSMLKEARENLSLNQEDIAKRLNFRPSLVNNMEEDFFDPALPTTFNRGYLVSYAKLVSVDVEDILASYDVLGAANTQRSEMQSFSKQTVKEAEHSRVMWLSYLILIVLVGLTALWWQQDNKQSSALVIDASSTKTETSENSLQVEPKVSENLLKNSAIDELSVKSSDSPQPAIDNTSTSTSRNANTDSENGNVENKDSSDSTELITPPVIEQILPVEKAQNNPLSAEDSQLEVTLTSTAIFIFSGDCWVNIFDATGERIAWGIKKSGYTMTIEGTAPFRVTLGKPELASISFNDQLIDMSTFNQGNIAKFTLPLAP